MRWRDYMVSLATWTALTGRNRSQDKTEKLSHFPRMPSVKAHCVRRPSREALDVAVNELRLAIAYIDAVENPIAQCAASARLWDSVVNENEPSSARQYGAGRCQMGAHCQFSHDRAGVDAMPPTTVRVSRSWPKSSGSSMARSSTSRARAR